jgi:hypothetical protein
MSSVVSELPDTLYLVMQVTALHSNMSPFCFYLQFMYLKHQQNMILVVVNHSRGFFL